MPAAVVGTAIPPVAVAGGHRMVLCAESGSPLPPLVRGSMPWSRALRTRCRSGSNRVATTFLSAFGLPPSIVEFDPLVQSRA